MGRVSTGLRWIGLAFVCVACSSAGIGSAADSEAVAEERPLAGRQLRVAIAPIATAVEFSGDKPYGAMIDIWEELARRLGLSTDYVRKPTFMDLM